MSLALDKTPFWKPVALLLLSCMLFTVYSLMVKLLSSELPPAQIAFSRFFFGYLFLQIASFAKARKIRLFWPEKQYLTLHLIRIGARIYAVITAVSALKYLSLSEERALSYLAPILFSIMGYVFLKEKLSSLRWLAILLGIMGVNIVAAPSYVSLSVMLLVYLSGRVAAAVADLYIRILRQRGESSQNVVGALFLIGSIVLGLLMPSTWINPSLYGWLGMIFIGISGSLFQYLYSYAFGSLGATMVAPFSYTTLFWAFCFDYLIFGSIPDLYGIIGSLLVVADAGLAILSIYRERREERC